jgi:hypothetical protein
MQDMTNLMFIWRSDRSLSRKEKIHKLVSHISSPAVNGFSMLIMLIVLDFEVLEDSELPLAKSI